MSTPRTLRRSPLGAASPASPRTPAAAAMASNSLSTLSAGQLNHLKESFHLLDKDGDGAISAGDLGAMLSSLGLPADAAYLASVPSPFNLASYLTHLSQHLAALSPPPDLLAAFAAFDENDDGTVDVRELTQALAHAGMPEADAERALRGFTKRRTLGAQKGGRGGDVFRYRDWVEVLAGKEEGEKE